MEVSMTSSHKKQEARKQAMKNNPRPNSFFDDTDVLGENELPVAKFKTPANGKMPKSFNKSGK